MASPKTVTTAATTVLSLSVLTTALTVGFDRVLDHIPTSVRPMLSRLGLQRFDQPSSLTPFHRRITLDDVSWRTLVVGILLFWFVFKIVVPRVGDAIRLDPSANVPEMKRLSWWTGNLSMRETDDFDGQFLIRAAKELNSSCYFLPATLGDKMLVLGDNVAINHVLHDVNAFPSTLFRLEFIRFVVGGGIIVAQGKDHARQRRVMGPAFTQAHIRTLAPIFTSKADELGEKLLGMVRLGDDAKWTEPGAEGAMVDMSQLMDRASFDIIGKAGFGLDFDCINKGLQGVELARGYNEMLQACVTFDVARLVLLLFSQLTRSSWLGLPLNRPNIVIQTQNNAVERMADAVLEKTLKRVRAIESGEQASKADDEPVDLIEMICRSNAQMQSSKGQSTSMTRVELSGMVRTLLFAGYETSSVTTSLTLHYLAHNQRILGRLQTQLLRFLQQRTEDNGGLETPLTAEELQGEQMSLLTNCIKETLRLSPAVTMSDRQCAQDCTIPLSRPIPTRDGRGTLSQLTLRKGTVLGTCFKLPNADERVWGPEPEAWNPDRWNDLPEAYKRASMPGPAGMTSFSNGPASCLGSRFAMLEMAALLVAILRRVRLEPSKVHEVAPKQVIVTRPVVKGKGIVALPLRVIPLEQTI